jgi:tetratricopeptide (TPR) repeat protein
VLDTRRVFATDADRLEAAAKSYRAAADARPGTTPGNLAKLGLAGVLYDQGKPDEAIPLYEQVLASELSKLDPEVRGRSLEGLGLCLEAKGDRDGALKRYGELENTDVAGFRELGLYDQARLLHAKGDDAGAKERLKKVIDKLGKDKAEEGEGNYLLEVSKDLLQRIDPSALPPPTSEEALQKALQEFQKKLPPGITPMQLPHPGGQ